MSELVKMYLDEPKRPGGPTEADVHESNIEECLRAGWMIAEEVETEDLLEGHDTIDELREFAELNELKLHHNASDVAKAKASLLSQMG